MALSPTTVPSFLKALESHIDLLKEKALNTATGEKETQILKVRIRQLQDVLSYAKGEAAELP